MTQLKVLLVSQWYDPEPVVQPRWIADALQRANGIAVDVLTGIPNYPDGVVASGYRASRPRKERLGGRTVYRTPLYPSHDASGLRRMANYVSWAVTASVVGLRRFRGMDASLVYSSPATAALPAMIARRVWRVPYVLLVQDVWPDSVFASQMLPRHMLALRWFLDRFVGLSYRWAARIVVISPGMKPLLISRGVPAGKIDVIYNWVSPMERPDQSGRAAARARLGISEDEFVVMYAGNHGAAQDLATVIEGVARVDAARAVRLVLIGEGVEKESLRSLADERCPARVTFMEQLPREDLEELMPAADVHLVSLAPDALFGITTPSKLQSIMSAGYPVLANAAGDVAAMIADASAGRAAHPGRPAEVARAINELAALSADQLEALGANGSSYYESRMSETVGAARLGGVLRAAAGEPDVE